MVRIGCVGRRNWGRVGVLFTVVLATRLLAAAPVFGACCACTGCPGAAATQCMDVGSCDAPALGGLLCSLGCEFDVGCSGSTFTVRSCSTIAGCPVSAPAVHASTQLVVALSLLTIGVYYLRRRRGPQAVRAAVMTATLLAGIGVVYAATQMQLGGGWQGASQLGSPLGTPARWTAELVRGDGNTLSGRVTVTGSSHLTGGNFQGHFAGSGVTGTLSDDGGTVVANVVGTVQNGTFHGQYTTPAGSNGTFTWDASNL